MRALVTGADGFAGQWLVQSLLQAGDEVSGASRAARMPLSTLGLGARDVDWHSVDLRDFDGLATMLARARPDVVYHLAAQASVPAALEDPLSTLSINVLGTATLLQACRTAAAAARIVAVGSADAYGRVESALLPLREDAPLNPNNPYAASKAAAEMVALQYARSGWLSIVAVRPFNHTGPGQSTAFAAPAFASQIAAIKTKKSAPIIRTGNLTACRDISDVRDVVRAYRLLAKSGTEGSVYNVCSGRAVSMQQVVDELAAIAGLHIDIQEDPDRRRVVETPVLVGDNSKIQRETGWRPSIALSQTLTDLYSAFLRDRG
ncbi:MAG: GDP-mannose 4,6-dehydratase [Candidatus Eremiobacteraeota bacterium]|nr:GDP-mannose 4,6-dehydratase [Candidatus Eremiobacteraeota bacterium]MBC5826288.1 GDP-mannose 4,6-dehydratase [Candidatus Eremiobacteraeota bacterium]